MAGEYSAGNLDLTLQAISADTISSLDKVIERLTTINSLLGKTVTKGTFGGRIAGEASGRSTEESIRQETYSLDRLNNKYLQIEKTIERINGETRIFTKTFDETGKLIRHIGEIRDAKGNVTKETYLDLPLTAKLQAQAEAKMPKTTIDSVYALTGLGEEYLRLQTQTIKSASGIEKITTEFNEQGEVVKKTSQIIDQYGNKTTKILQAQAEDGTPKTTMDSVYAINRLGKEYLQLQTETIKSASGVQKITTEFNEQGKAIKKTTQIVDEYGNKTTKIKSFGKSAGSGLFGFGALRLGSMIYLARRLGRALAYIVQQGSNFDETLNMWQVSMRNSLDLADQFVGKMHDAYGISTETLMRNQAIYKNMLSQMGQLTEETSYKLSESLTRMMLDYSSLWNTTIEQASEKFKAMLAGQIRPIRAVSGISVEEQAIYDIYRNMGGTKTMRQLTQVEKRLLRIYATFSQMQESGATVGAGDFAKTLEKFANQSRLMSEYWKELATWIGMGFKHLIESTDAMQFLNALLITSTEIIKALVKAGGYEEENYLSGLLETTETENDAIDELQGKLLDFDKFRALEDTTGQANLAIDQKVLDLLASYSSSLDNVTNRAKELADTWLEAIGFKRVNGELEISEEKLNGIKTALTAIGVIIGGLIALNIYNLLARLATSIFKVSNMMGVLNTAIFAVGFSLSKGFFEDFINDFEGTERKIASWGTIVVGVLGTVLGLILAIKEGTKYGWAGALAAGLGAGAIVAGIKGLTSDVQFMKNGGMVDSGTMFIAGEAGAEIVSTSSSGQTGVANTDQIAMATYRGNMMFWAQAKRDLQNFGSVTIAADSEGIFTIVENTARRKGKKFANA